jgi:methionyl-tRNA formyltransferase
MNIVVLSVEERLYLPAYFERFLAARGHQTKAVFLAPLRHGRQSTFDMIAKYRRAFGWTNLMRLVKREGKARVFDRLGIGVRRGRPYSVQAIARRHDVLCEVIPDVNAPEFHERLRSIPTDLIVSVSCPQIFKQPLIDLPPRGCLNVHGALLPRYRGLAPSFWMMRNGETRAGVTVFLVNEDIDLGDIVEVVEFDIDPQETLEEFIIRTRLIACDAVLRAIEKIESGEATTRPLTKEGGSYFSFPTRDDYLEFRRRGRRLW